MYKALKTFAGKIVMKKGDTKDFIKEEIAKDLLRAGYIEEIKLEAKPVVEEIKDKVVEETKEVEKPKKTTTRKKKI